MKRKIILKEWHIILFLFIMALFSKILFISSSPNFWDSAEYMGKIKELVYEGKYLPVSMSHNKPLYIFIGAGFTYIYYWLTGIINIELALQLVSIIFGAISIIPLFYLGKYIGFSKKACIISSFIFIAIPITWWFGEEGLADVPAMLFLITGVAFLFKWHKENKLRWLMLSGLVTGTGLLVRFVNIFIIVVYVLVIIIHIYVKHKKSDKKDRTTGQQKDLSLDICKICFGLLMVAFPVIIYLAIELARNPNLEIGYFFTSPENATFNFMLLFDKLNFLGTVYYTVNGISLSLLLFSVLGIIYFILDFRKDWGIQKLFINKVIVFSSLIIWGLSFTVYYTGIFRPISRYTIAAAPVFCLFGAYFIANKSDKAKKLMILLLITIPFDLLINYFDISEVYYGNGIINTVYSIINFIDIKYIVISSVIIILWVIISFGKFHFLNSIDTSWKIAILVVIVLILHTYPILNLMVTKINYQKSIAVWYQQNTPENALLIGGQELPFDYYYATPRNVVWYKPVLNKWESTDRSNYTRVRNDVIKALNARKNVFTSSDRYIRPILNKLNQDFKVRNIGIISKDILRNQYDWGAVFMNFASMSKAEDIEIYEINLK